MTTNPYGTYTPPPSNGNTTNTLGQTVTPGSNGGYQLSNSGVNQGSPSSTAAGQFVNSVMGWQSGGPAAPLQSAYTAQNANNILQTAAANASLGKVANNGATTAAKLGGTSQFNAAGIAPLMMLNGSQVSTSADNQNAAAQQQAINNLNNIASGNGPNAATIAAQQQGQQAMAQQMAMAAAGGGNPALAQRNATDQLAAAQQNIAQNAVAGSAQEQLGAQSTLQSALANTRAQGQAIPLAQAQLNQQAQLANQQVQSQGALTQAQLNQQAAASNAGALNTSTLQQGAMNQQTQLANQQALLASTQMNAQQQNAMLGVGVEQNSYDTSQAEAYQNAIQQEEQAYSSLAEGHDIASNQEAGQVLGAGVSAVGTGTAAIGQALGSDIRLKTNIKSANKSSVAFLNAYKAKLPKPTKETHPFLLLKRAV